MDIKRKTAIVGIGLIAGLSTIVAGGAAANAASNRTTTATSDIGFHITQLAPYSVNFTWDANKVQVNSDSTSYCDVDLIALDGPFPGIASYKTLDASAGSASFASDDTNAVIMPGYTYDVQFTCMDSVSNKLTYTSSKFVAPDIAPTTPSKPQLDVYDDALYGMVQIPAAEGKSETGSCTWQLYRNGSLYSTVSDDCDTMGIHTFSNLPSGSYAVAAAARNSVGVSNYSARSAAVTVKSSNPVVGPAKTAVKKIAVNFKVAGKNVTTKWSAVKNATKYNVKITHGSKVVLNKTLKSTHVAKKLAHGKYQVTVTAYSSNGTHSTTSVNVKF